jgi:uncharacterized membrane protein
MSGFGEVQLRESLKNPDLRSALEYVLGVLDSVWIVLAAANVYLPLSEREGLATVRKWAFGTALLAWCLGASSARWGWPLGPILYTDRLGLHLGPVPFGLPIIWFVVVLGSRGAALWVAPRASHGSIAILAGLLSALSDWNLEGIAWKVRVWWLWYPRELKPPAYPPVRNSLAWLVAATALVYFFRERDVVRSGVKQASRPALVFCVINTVWLLGHLAWH